jgi:hypothetical protein
MKKCIRMKAWLLVEDSKQAADMIVAESRSVGYHSTIAIIKSDSVANLKRRNQTSYFCGTSSISMCGAEGI